MVKSKLPELVYLEWFDSVSTGGNVWADKPHVDGLVPDSIKSIGWIVKDTKDYITIVNSISEYQYSGDMCIPKFAITKRKKINGVKT